MRYILILMLLLVSAETTAQTIVQPKVTVDAPMGPVLVGQPAIVRITVLVPTYMPAPPVFPSLEQENLLVRLPERASGPVSETIEGETWSGVQRSYRLYPLQTGSFDFGGQSVGVTFADPDTNDPVQVSVSLPPLTLSATVPDAARDLDPTIIASGFKVEQLASGGPDVSSGGAVTRRLTATIAGTTPLLIPSLIPEAQDPILRAYPKEPKITETEDRGVLSGQRVDEVTYLAVDGGQAQLPAISIRWFNLENNQVETIEIPAVDLNLAPPPKELMTLEDILRPMIWAVALIFFLWLLWKTTGPRFQNWQLRRKRRYLASDRFARDRLRAALKARDLSGAYTALSLCRSRGVDPSGLLKVENCLIQIGATRYSNETADNTNVWHAALSVAGKLRHAQSKHAQLLPPLNP